MRRSRAGQRPPAFALRASPGQAQAPLPVLTSAGPGLELVTSVFVGSVMNRECDCQTCGACCASPYSGEAYVALNDGEAIRFTLTRLPVILQRQGGDPPEFLPRLGTKLDANATKVCAAFGGVVGSTCFCSVYEKRPSACGQFEVGGRACREARRRMGVAASDPTPDQMPECAVADRPLAQHHVNGLTTACRRRRRARS